jgi:hypothetical protein
MHLPHQNSAQIKMPTRVTTTLDDVLTALQTVVEMEEDAVVVAIVAAWLHSGRLRFPEDVASAA